MSAAANRVLSVLERAKMVCWFEETNSLAMVARRYRAEFGMDPPSLSQIKKIHKHFLETGSVVADGSADSAASKFFNSPQLNSTEALNLSQQQALHGQQIGRFA